MTDASMDHIMNSMIWLAGLLFMLMFIVVVGNLALKFWSTPRAPRLAAPAEPEAMSRSQRKALGEQQRAADAERRRSAIARIDAVRDDYGARLSDPAYVIQYHAIDDPAFPQTAAFVDAYAAATSYDLGKLDADALEATAGRLERAWRACRQHAERIGLDALGEHKKEGHRALGLVRTAADPATPAAQLPDLQRKIDALMVVCQITLPTKAHAAILPPERRQLTAEHPMSAR